MLQAGADRPNTAAPGGRGPTAFVMAGGGSLGAVEVGMLRELLRRGERPAFVVGASAGAINGAFFASDPTPDGVARLEAIWCGLTRRTVFPLNWASLWGMFTGRRAYLVDASGLRRLLERYLPYRRLEDAALPVHVVASDIRTGDEVLLSSGDAVDAVLASAAIPGVFPPVCIDGRLLVDGGVANNTPISSAVRLGAGRIVVLPTGFTCALQTVPKSAIGRAMHALNLLVMRQLVSDTERYAATVELHVVPSLCPLTTSPYDYSSSKSLIEQAAEETRRWIDEGGLDTAALPLPLRLLEHNH